MNLALRNLPNLITLLRMALVVPVSLAILNDEFGWALALFATASLSDGIDGFLARRFNWVSRFGAIADPLADKLMLIASFLLLTYTGHLPLWLAAVVIGRDLIVVAGAISYHYMFGAYTMAPTYLGKLSTSLQFILVLFVLIDLSLLPLSTLLLEVAIWLAFAVSSISGIDYVITWGRKALAAAKA